MRGSLTSGTKAARSVVVSGTLLGTWTQAQMGCGMNRQDRSSSAYMKGSAHSPPTPAHYTNTHPSTHLGFFSWPVRSVYHLPGTR